MRLIKAETYLKPIPSNHIVYEEANDRYSVLPILTSEGRPKGKKFNFKPRSYVFAVYSGNYTWTQVKFDTAGFPLKFDVPGDLILNPRPYSIFLGYNDGFLGGNFTPGYYSLKEKVQYWYCIAQTSSKYPMNSYFVRGDGAGVSSVIIDVSNILLSPAKTQWIYHQIGDSIKIGDNFSIGDTYEQ